MINVFPFEHLKFSLQNANWRILMGSASHSSTGCPGRAKPTPSAFLDSRCYEGWCGIILEICGSISRRQMQGFPLLLFIGRSATMRSVPRSGAFCVSCGDRVAPSTRDALRDMLENYDGMPWSIRPPPAAAQWRWMAPLPSTVLVTVAEVLGTDSFCGR